jgi:arylsulfatase A-like enzyme
MTNYTRRDFLRAAGTTAASLAITNYTLARGKTGNRPNILMILVDDLGYGDLSSYGAKDMQTPNIDKLMESGMRFDNFYANCPVCSPTRASLLTGRYPDLVGVPGVIRTHLTSNWGYLAPQAVLLPKLLSRTGYHTAMVGKWHLGLESPNIPNERGFDHFHGFLGDMMDD